MMGYTYICTTKMKDMDLKTQNKQELERQTKVIMNIIEQASSGKIDLEKEKQNVEQYISIVLKQIQMSTAMHIKNSISDLF